jgi:hypothetical protein
MFQKSYNIITFRFKNNIKCPDNFNKGGQSMEDIEELKLLEKILLLVKDYNDTYNPEIYDSKVDLKAVKRS